MRSITRLCSVMHRLISVFFSAWLPHALKITLLSAILAVSAAAHAITDYKYNAMIKKRTSRFVYYRHKSHYYYYFSRRRPPSSAEALECAICITEFSDGEAGMELERCGHRFHAGCMEKWMAHGTGQANCPLCRAPVAREGAVEEHRKVKSEGRLLSNAFREELGLLLLSGLRGVSCCQGHNTADCKLTRNH
ncbi:PREDICTED: RING-H2 finger protein ATL64-like [Ipomoea nil]|uniref:RING-H2 finger protein ATL64-like n=1 Tax=Ipomoea nil TaxID=35883 RepID=UPI000901BF5E|nr:PREDICTED: RING-H2 finger protein ATL64-like [Ipomoea nil]